MNVTTNEDLIAAKTRLTNIKADQAELKLKVMRGEYVPLSEVQARQAEEVMRVKTKMLAIPVKLARQLADKRMSALEVSEILTCAVNEALQELSNPQDEE